MSKGLAALEEIRERCNTNDYGFTDYDEYLDKKCDIVEKELKALEIIKRLPADYLQTLLRFIRDEQFKDEDFGGFIAWGGDETPILINKEEFDLLKEVLL